MRWAARLTKPVLLVVAFTLSMVLYLYVQSQTPPNQTETVELLVHAIGYDPQLIFVGEGVAQKFEVSGPADELRRLDNRLKSDPRVLQATIDLTKENITAAKLKNGPWSKAVGLSVHRPDGLKELVFTQIGSFPARLELRMTARRTIQLRLTHPSGADAGAEADPADYLLIPDRVTLQGPQSEIDDALPIVTVNADDVELTGIVQAPLTIISHTSNSTTLPDLLSERNATVEVRPLRQKRAAYVNVSFVGHLPAGYRITNYYVVGPSGPTSTANIRGPGGLVDKTSTIDATVDISALKSGFTFEPTPMIPPRIELVDVPLRIRVDVEKVHK